MTWPYPGPELVGPYGEQEKNEGVLEGRMHLP